MPQNLTTWDLLALLPIQEEGVLRIFIALKESIALTGFEPATFGSSDNHTNHYTTKATWLGCYKIKLHNRNLRSEALRVLLHQRKNYSE
jgi:hypothetical protein